MKSVTGLSLISFLLTVEQCSAKVDHKSRLRERHLSKLAEKSQYGDGDSNDGDGNYGHSYPGSLYFLRAGYEHTCAVDVYEDVMKCWGSNGSGQLGLGDKLPRGDQKNEMGDSLQPVSLEGSDYIDYVALGGFHTCVGFADSKAKCFGDNRYGQLGYGDTKNRGDQPNEMGKNLPFLSIGERDDFDQIATGLFHTCFYFFDSFQIACFGNNEHGQLGVGNKINRGGSSSDIGANVVYTDIEFNEEYLSLKRYIYSAPTANHTCLVDHNVLAIQCWGRNSKGQLGYGDTNNRGDQPNEMGKNLASIPIQKSENIDGFAVGGSNTCYVINGNAYCFGDNQYGQLGLGNTDTIGDEPNEMGKNLKPMNIGNGFQADDVTIGSGHICVKDLNTRMKCFGRNSFGQLGQGDKINRGTSSTTIGTNVPVIDFETGESSILEFIAGDSHTCVHFDNDPFPDSIKCFGNGSKGRLGSEDTKNRGDEKNEMGEMLPRVSLKYWAPSVSPTKRPTEKPTTSSPTKKPTTRTPTKKPSRKKKI